MHALLVPAEPDIERSTAEVCDNRLTSWLNKLPGVATYTQSHSQDLINNGKSPVIQIDNVFITTEQDVSPNDLAITASSELRTGFFKEIPEPLHADMNELVTEQRAEMTGNVLLYWQNIEYLDNLFRHLGHRTPLTHLQDQMPAYGREHGHIEDAIGRHVHLKLDSYTYRTFYQESGAGVTLVLLHAADSDARMWRHQLGDLDLEREFRVIAFNMPWHEPLMPPQELLRTEYFLSSDFYRRFIRAFCDALKLERPVLAGCSMGGLYSFPCCEA